MIYTIVRITFEDYGKWKAAFDEAANFRRQYGSKGIRVLRSPDKPNEAVLIGEYEDAERAREMFQSQAFRDATKRAGVLGPPTIDFLDEVDRLPA